jgi:ABC-2 type transport system ATP-binding protein
VTRGRLIASGSVDEIRAHVSRKSIQCRSSLTQEQLAAWPDVSKVHVEAGRLHITTRDAEAVLRRLLAADTGVQDIEVRRAGLAEAFAEITNATGNPQ